METVEQTDADPTSERKRITYTQSFQNIATSPKSFSADDLYLTRDGKYSIAAQQLLSASLPPSTPDSPPLPSPPMPSTLLAKEYRRSRSYESYTQILHDMNIPALPALRSERLPLPPALELDGDAPKRPPTARRPVQWTSDDGLRIMNPLYGDVKLARIASRNRMERSKDSLTRKLASMHTCDRPVSTRSRSLTVGDASDPMRARR
eukprot:TRINITY_DN898_c0_g1_i2.p2 TRINITY_DN898_c0_g1~~TRINITY_DN898_c0_g1_i2.p2  ORF type:complete len:206 (-),score=51.69 TRINITY_DN898_c0_g1_i2:288-905(-)